MPSVFQARKFEVQSVCVTEEPCCRACWPIAAKQYLLVELSDFGIAPELGDSLLRLQAAGMVPVITHPERNAILQRQLGLFMEWVEAGCLVQVTASAVTGSWGGAPHRVAYGAVHVLASDATLTKSAS
jgi:protein-tyrosine phosphatase